MKVRELNRQQICVFNDDDELIAGVNLGRYRPWIYPLFTPSGQNVLREFPPDHGFHNGAFFGHYPLVVDGLAHNFWGAPPFRGKDDEMARSVGTIRSKPREIVEKFGIAEVSLNCEWITENDRKILEEIRVYLFTESCGIYSFKTISRIQNVSSSVLVFEKTKCSGHAMRLSHNFCLQHGASLFLGSGEISLSEAHGLGIPERGVSVHSRSGFHKTSTLNFLGEIGVPLFLRDYGLTAVNPFLSQSKTLLQQEAFQFYSEVFLNDLGC